MNFGDLIGSLTTFDLIVIVYLIAWFVLGFAQGTIRRLLGIGAVLFSFLLASNLRDPLGAFLADNWHQFPREYSYMVAYLAIFLAAFIAFSLVVQGFYKPAPLFEKARFVDEVLGGLLGVLEGLLLLGAIIVILDSAFALPGVPVGRGELPLLRDFWNAMNESQTAVLFRTTLIPAFMFVFGFFIPDSIESLYRRV
ncbi:MAG: CvpA family protein [Chloroflexota bacterium]